MTTQKELKAAVRGTYDLQKLRIMAGNRIVANFYAKQGIEPGKKPEDDKKVKKIIDALKQDYERLTDGLITMPTKHNFKGSEIISDYLEFVLVMQYVDILKSETQSFNSLKSFVKDFDIWNHYLIDVKGIGPAIGGVLISEIDISKAKYPSSLIKWAGVDVAEDGKARSKRTEHLVDREYIDKKGKLKTKKSITFNPFLKTKLLGVLGPSFLKAGQTSPYAKIYYDYKNRLENHKIYKDTTKGHRHKMANRYMVKMFLIDLHINWRSIAGLPVSDPYHIAKLGYQKHAA